MIITCTNENFQIKINVSSEDERFFINELEPYFFIKISNESVTENIWLINLVSDKNIASFKKVVEKANPKEPKKIFYVNTNSKEIRIEQPDDMEWRKHLALRLIRDLFRVYLVGNDGIPLHGGLIERSGLGIAVLGGKKAGKTTTILSLMDDKSFYITNDDLIVKNKHNKVFGYGSTRSMSIRKDTLPFLNKNIGNIVTTNPLNQTSLMEEYLFIKPNELFSKQIKSSCNIALFIFPKFDSKVSRPKLQYLSDSNLLDELRNNVEDTTLAYFPKLFEVMFSNKNSSNLFQKHLEEICDCEVKGIVIKQSMQSIISFDDLIKEV